MRFADIESVLQHVESDHPVVVCWDCGGIVVEMNSLELHYAESSSHPSCGFCGVGKRNATDMAEVCLIAKSTVHTILTTPRSTSNTCTPQVRRCKTRQGVAR